MDADTRVRVSSTCRRSAGSTTLGPVLLGESQRSMRTVFFLRSYPLRRVHCWSDISARQRRNDEIAAGPARHEKSPRNSFIKTEKPNSGTRKDRNTRIVLYSSDPLGLFSPGQVITRGRHVLCANDLCYVYVLKYRNPNAADGDSVT